MGYWNAFSNALSNTSKFADDMLLLVEATTIAEINESFVAAF